MNWIVPGERTKVSIFVACVTGVSPVLMHKTDFKSINSGLAAKDVVEVELKIIGEFKTPLRFVILNNEFHTISRLLDVKLIEISDNTVKITEGQLLLFFWKTIIFEDSYKSVFGSKITLK